MLADYQNHPLYLFDLVLVLIAKKYFIFWGFTQNI